MFVKENPDRKKKKKKKKSVAKIIFVKMKILAIVVLLTMTRNIVEYIFKGTLSDLRQFLTNEIPLKMMKNAFYFTLKALFILKIFKILSWLFGHM